MIIAADVKCFLCVFTLLYTFFNDFGIPLLDELFSHSVVVSDPMHPGSPAHTNDPYSHLSKGST